MVKIYTGIIALAVVFSAKAEKISFSDQIRPLFNRSCTGCHGGVKESGGLSLLSAARALGKTNHGIGIVPGKPHESMVYKVITSPPEVFDKRQNKKRRLKQMPMEKEPLTKEEIALVKQWIEEGATWEEHWAYTPPSARDLPEIDSAWPENRIDYFTLAKMKSLGLKPSQEADKGVILRRVFLDLTGLPPTIKDLREFQNDNTPEAYEKVVDKLLASPAYGEKWAAMWLDLARYADTQGYEKDGYRTIYRFRDEVIKSFNRDTPYDQFLIEQLAGDLLPNPTTQQKILTALHRNTMTNNEGGTDDEEFRVAAVVDRVNTTWEAFMGTSFSCVQCHTHPYDPFFHDEYFKFMAFFNNTADNDRPNEAPVMRSPDVYQQQQLDQWNKELAELKLKVDSEKQHLSNNFETLYEDLINDLERPVLKPLQLDASKRTGGYHLREDDSGKATFKLAGQVDLNKINHLQVESLPASTSGDFTDNPNPVPSKVELKVKRHKPAKGRFVRIELTKKGVLSLAEVQVIRAGENIALRQEASQSSTVLKGKAQRALDGNTSGLYKQNSVTHTSGNDVPWWEVNLGDSTVIDEVIIFNGKENSDRLNGCTVSILNDDRELIWQGKIQSAKEKHRFDVDDFTVDFTLPLASLKQHNSSSKYDSGKKKGKGRALTAAVDTNPAAWFSSDSVLALHKDDLLEVTLSFQSPVTQRFGVKLGYGKINQSQARLIGLVGKKAVDLEQTEKDIVIDYLLNKGSHKKIVDKYLALQADIKNFKVATTPIMQELPPDKRRKTRVFIGGSWENLGEEVSEGTPEIMNEFKDEWPRNRLGMAYWMTSADNPLTARVAVNRFWEQLFGMGIVETLEDFGSQGFKPTHPDLLDDLAHRFIHEHRWSIKSLLKEMVMSATYRQSSDTNQELLEKDPFNHFLSRGPRFRLSAEQIRDQALFVSGLMSDKMYGPSVMPFQPEGVWMSVYNQNKWTTSKNGDQHRRALYTFWKRTSPYPSMEAFDTPTREVCKVRRLRTNTPLQALVTLNDPVFIEYAEKFGEWISAQPGNLDFKLNKAFEKALCRQAGKEELTMLKKLFTDIQRNFGKSTGEAWTLVSNVILNLDEFLVKR